MNPFQPSEDDLHAYLDGRLSAEQHAAVAAYLASHPDVAAEVAGWQDDARQLRAALANLQALPGNPRLDPQAIRRHRLRRRQRYLASAAVLLLTLGLGLAGGWQARERSLRAATPPMQDALTAHRLFAEQAGAPLDVAANEQALQAWLDRHFKLATPLPAVERLGLHPVGGRLLTTEQGPAALLVFEDGEGRRLSLYLRTPGTLYADMPAGQRRDGELEARYWSRQGYNFALVGSREAPPSEQLQQALRF